ncbi:hypothetical protein VTH82DRAFT_7956 [Thermothelomyces myriococcoides]
MAEPVDESEFWINSDEEEEVNHRSQGLASCSSDPTYFRLDLEQTGQEGGKHTQTRPWGKPYQVTRATRLTNIWEDVSSLPTLPKKKDFRTSNLPGKKQREVVTGYSSGLRRRPAFFVGCEAKAIVHGTLNQASDTRATLLVSDFCFFSYRSARIKRARAHFEFRSKTGVPGAGPLVLGSSPVACLAAAPASIIVMAAQGTQGPSSKIETYAAEVTGNRLPDEWGNHFEVSWSLKENPSQPTGIVRQLRTCILLTRETDDEFQLVPTIEVTPNFAGRAVSLFSSRPADDPVVFDPSYEPYNKLDREIRCVSARSKGSFIS